MKTRVITITQECKYAEPMKISQRLLPKHVIEHKQFLRNPRRLATCRQSAARKLAKQPTSVGTRLHATRSSAPTFWRMALGTV
jgi:hypothetical protein